MTLLDASSATDLLGPDSISELRNAARALPTVLLLEAPSALATLVIPLISEAVIPTRSARLSDLRVCAPEALNWSVDEIASQVISPTTMTPSVRNLLIVLDAQTMSSAGADLLLKTIEEPLAPTTFVLCTPSIDALPATIRGRAQRSLSLGVSPAALTRLLEQSGQDPALVAQAASLVGSQLLDLADLVGQVDPLAELLSALCSLPPTARAASSALALSDLLTTLTAQLSPDTLSRRRARQLAGLLLAAWRTLVVQTLASRPELAARASSRLGGFDSAQVILDRNGPVATALALALVGA